MTENDPDLSAAYALETPEDNLRLYADWAQSYDRTFAQDMDYKMPQRVAAVFAKVGGGRTPVLDVGAGTGLLAAALPVQEGAQIDALDLSPDMLAVAMGKGLYGRAIEADLTQPLDIADGVYGGVVSSGTFTHGHVGPDAMDELLRVAQSGAAFALAINKEHFETRGFEAKFARLEPVIDQLELRRVNIYGAGAKGAHKDDQALVAVFFKR